MYTYIFCDQKREREESVFLLAGLLCIRDNVVLLMGRNDGGLTTNRLSSNGRCTALHAREAGSKGGERTSGRKQEIGIGKKKKKNHTLWPAVECHRTKSFFLFSSLSLLPSLLFIIFVFFLSLSASCSVMACI